MKRSEGWDWDKALEMMPDRWTEVADELFSFSRQLKNAGCKRVYDLGCGVGRHTLFLAQQGFEVVASDISPSAISHTRNNLDRAGVEAETLALDMTEWPFKNGSFDAIVAFNVAYHATCDKVERVIAEAMRALVPGGLMFITFKSTLDSEFGKGEQLAPFTFSPTGGVEIGIPHYYVDEAEARRLLAGFEIYSLILKQELPVSADIERYRAHWVIQVRKPDSI